MRDFVESLIEMQRRVNNSLMVYILLSVAAELDDAYSAAKGGGALDS